MNREEGRSRETPTGRAVQTTRRVSTGRRSVGGGPLSKALFSQRIVSIDFYTAAPVPGLDPLYSEFRLSDVPRVPVLRIYGSTPKGQKTCTHIHGVFPYIYILHDSGMENMERRIALAIDQAVNDFLGSAVKDRFDRTSKPQQHVFKAITVTGRTFYGYRPREETFIRIYFYNPLIVKKVVDLLLNGSILNQKFQPYEAHIPYQLQFMIDYNLYGMNLVHYSDVKFRRHEGLNLSVSPVSSVKLSPFSGSGVSKLWDLFELPESMFTSAALERNTVCELEIDVLAADIIVLSATSGVRSCNPGIDAIWQDEMERRRNRDEENSSQITIPDSQARVYKQEMFPSEAQHRKVLDDKLENLIFRDKILEMQRRELPDISASSQLVTHLPSDFNFKRPAVDLNRTEESEIEEDELFILLQELQKEKELIERGTTNENDNYREIDEYLDDDLQMENIEKEENVLEEENIWEQSFLCNTILDEEFLAKEAMALEEADDERDEIDQEPEDEAVEGEMDDEAELSESDSKSPKPSHLYSPAVSPLPSSGNIFQGDGQGGDSDSSSGDDKPAKSVPTRRSNRISMSSKAKKLTPGPKSTKAAGTPNQVPKSSPQPSIELKNKMDKIESLVAVSRKSESVSSSPVVNKSDPEKTNTPTTSASFSRSSKRLGLRNSTHGPTSIEASSSSKGIKVTGLKKAGSKISTGIELVIPVEQTPEKNIVSKVRLEQISPVVVLDRCPAATIKKFASPPVPENGSSSTITEEPTGPALTFVVRGRGRPKNKSSTKSRDSLKPNPSDRSELSLSADTVLNNEKKQSKNAELPEESTNIRSKKVSKNLTRTKKVRLLNKSSANASTVTGNEKILTDPDTTSKLDNISTSRVEKNKSFSCPVSLTKSIDKAGNNDEVVSNSDASTPELVVVVEMKSPDASFDIQTTRTDDNVLPETTSPKLFPEAGGQITGKTISTNEIVTTDYFANTSKSVEVQTDEYQFTGPLCRCQCTSKSITKDASTDIQADLKPKMKNKNLQIEFSDIMWKSKKTTPPHKSLGSTNARNNAELLFQNKSPKSPLNCLGQREISHKHNQIVRGDHSPSDRHKSGSNSPKKSQVCQKITTAVLNSNEKCPKKGKNIVVPTVAYKSLLKQVLRRNSISHEIPAIPGEEVIDADANKSVNSIYERSSPFFVEKHAPMKINGVSIFEIKRSATKSKAKYKKLARTSAMLEANLNAPDVFSHEFEPLKLPFNYKSVLKFNQSEEAAALLKEARNPAGPVSKLNHSEMSSDEEAQEVVRFCFGEGFSDNEDSQDSWKDDSFAISNDQSAVKIPDGNKTPVPQTSTVTPKSILRMNTGGRRIGEKAKRKIRWEDELAYKKMKTLSDGSENGETKSLPVQVLKNVDANSEPPKAINASELDGLSPKNNFGFEHDMSNLKDAKAMHQHQYLTTWSVEVHCDVRDDLIPDPGFDPVLAIFVYISNDVPDVHRKPKQVYKCLHTHRLIKELKFENCEYYKNEDELLDAFLRLYHEWDPDLLVGYEIEKFSWGYIIDRGIKLGRNMTKLLSRLLPTKRKTAYQERKDEKWDGMICGRIVLNLWKLLRHEITVQSYTYENAAYHILHRRVSKFKPQYLADKWNLKELEFVLDYYSERVKGVVELMETLDLTNRTSELARLFGIQFYEVFSRGSQFRVESMMIRTARPFNLIPISPGIAQRAKMRAPEFLPLILEPKSNFYTDPVAVLDFQSLYPSMIIAYNYDYATVLGRVEHLGAEGPFELGCLETVCSPFDLNRVKDSIHVSPAGVAFVDASIRKGILPEMLEQILDTRQMVKRSAKKWKSEGATLQKILDSRQLGLKLIANVTYGYTSANFSGRMPCIEIADSVVSKGRETLQRAIDLVKSNHDRWGGEVIYGDTDSLFVKFPGKNRQEAFQLAQEIADEVTQSNPKPVKLKLEKVYQPCILQSKKRYVGYSYETPDQKEPKYDAKGIETVRRDGCPAVKKILEKSLHILFTTCDPVKVQNYVEVQFKKLFTGRVSMKEYTFARAFRGLNGYKPGACVPSLEIAKREIEKDPRAEPLTKERVPYVVIYGKPTLPLIQLVRTPDEFMNDYTMRLNAHYYIEKVIIPALNRCLVLANMDASKWYKDLPRNYLRNILEENKCGLRTLDNHLNHENCIRCDEKTEKGRCFNCDCEKKKTVSYIKHVSKDLDAKLETARKICESCSDDSESCVNLDCPVLPKLLRYERDEYFHQQVLNKIDAMS